MARRDPRARYLASAPPAFQESFGQIAALVHQTFPSAEEVFAYRMPGWKMRRRLRKEDGLLVGTIDPRYVWLLVAARSRGLTVHLWNPADPGCLQRNVPILKEAGLTVLRGCLQHTRKQPFPIAPLRTVLREVRRTSRL